RSLFAPNAKGRAGGGVQPQPLPPAGTCTGRRCPATSALCFVHSSSRSIPMSLKEQLTDDMKTAMRAGDKDRLGVIRLVLAAIKQREVDERIQLDDAQVLSVLEKMLKQRKDSITQYSA